MEKRDSVTKFRARVDSVTKFYEVCDQVSRDSVTKFLSFVTKFLAKLRDSVTKFHQVSRRERVTP